MRRTIIPALFLFASPALAQPTSQSAAGPGVSASAAVWNTMTNYVVKAADQIPESDYGFRPVAGVRTVGELIGHVAGAQYMFCAAALGEPARREDDIEKTAKTKAALTTALRASTEFCKRAYAQTDAAAAGMTKLFGQDLSKMFALSLNAAHNGEHYGNLVTYMRIKGMVPPSSQPTPPPESK